MSMWPTAGSQQQSYHFSKESSKMFLYLVDVCLRSQDPQDCGFFFCEDLGVTLG